MEKHVPEAVIRRLPGYYRHLRELEAAGVAQISSQELGERMNQNPSQIRQDIHCFGGFGRQGYGYSVSELKEHIGNILGLDRPHPMIIVGAGSIGTAVARYPSFTREGFNTVAMFDVDPQKVGMEVGEVTVRAMDELEAYLREHEVDIVVLAVPAEGAQETLDRLIAAGVNSVWNFAPVDLVHPAEVLVINVHLSDSLQILSYKMRHRGEEPQ